MGKSTLIQWLIVTLATKAPLPPAAEGLRGAIPLPFILRDLVGHLPKDITRWDWPALLTAFRNYHPRAADCPALAAALTADGTQFASILDSERAFFLIDGLDEIGDPDHRRALRNALWQGFDQHRAARWLITSRVVGYDEAVVDSVKIEREATLKFTAGEAEEFRKLLFAARIPDQPGLKARRIFERGILIVKQFAHLLYLAPFDNEQQIAFARNWYMPRLGEVPGAERATGFVRAVREHPSVRIIGRVPNLLYLLALLYRHKAHLPNGRALVYAAISDAYLEGIDLDRHLGGHQTIPYKLSDKVRFLATIARHVQERRAAQERDASAGEILVTREELEQWLAPHFPGDEGCAALHAFIRYVAARSGLLLPRGEGLFGFAHLSFQEYYAACWLEEEFRRLLNAQARGDRAGFLRRAATAEAAGSLTREGFAELASHPSWREPLVFLVEKLSTNADDTLTLIDWLFPQLNNPTASTEQGEQKPAFIPIEAARLLAALSLDPQVALAPEERQGIWAIFWREHLDRQQQGGHRWDVAPMLLAASDFQPHIWSALVSLQPPSLDLRNCTGVADLAPLAGLARLQFLYLSGCIGVADLAPLAGLAQLRRLDLIGCTGAADLAPLAGLARLEVLDLSGCTGVADLAPLAGLAQLQGLDLSDCTGVADLAPLAGLARLEVLDLSFCAGVTDLAPLAGLARLQSLYLRGCAGLNAETVATFRQSHPNVRVVGP